jgi:hypothetical protein
VKAIDEWNDGIKLIGTKEPEPTAHPDPRMHLTLRDCAKFYDPPQSHEKKVYPLASTKA